MPNPKLETYKNKATGTVYDFTDADAQSKISATVDMLKDTTGWLGKNEVDVTKYNHISTNCVASASGDDVMTFTAPTAATGNYAELSYYASQTSDVLFDHNEARKMMIIVTALTSNKAAIGVRSSESRFIKTLKFESTGTYILDLSDVAEDYYVGVYPRWEYNNAEASITFKLMVYDARLDDTYEPYHESVEDWYWSENAKTGAHNFVLGSLSGYSIGAQGNIYADATYDLHYGIVKQGESYIVTTDDSAGFVGGYFTSMPTPSSVTYNSSRVVSANKTFTAPIDGYVVFRTTHNYATPMFCLADDSYDGYTKGAMTNRQLTEMLDGKADDMCTTGNHTLYMIATAITPSNGQPEFFIPWSNPKKKNITLGNNFEVYMRKNSSWTKLTWSANPVITRAENGFYVGLTLDEALTPEEVFGFRVQGDIVFS